MSLVCNDNILVFSTYKKYNSINYYSIALTKIIMN